MGRLLKAIVFLLLLGFIALVGYAYVGDLSPVIIEVNQPVTLDAE
ncbi:hypothetical protein [Profundibacter sp.]